MHPVDTAATTGSAPVELSPLKRALLALEEMKARLDRAERGEPVAVIGIGCRLPGGVSDAAGFRQRLLDGFDAITDIPADRWSIDDWHDGDGHAPGKMNMRRGGFLAGGIDGFDAEFFGIAPREAAGMDPQQRVLLETAWSALEDAAIPADSLAGTGCGVYVGLYNNNYTLMGRGSPAVEQIDGWTASGGHTSVAAGRLSYVLGLTGPAMAVDTACSSSLTAVHLAVRALQGGECSLALAGGVHLILSPEALVASTKLGATAPDGRCKAFDAAADGFGHGEGCGIVVLKRLSDARAAGDRILAVIRGTAVNQDGRSNSLTAPNGPSQEAVVRAALARGGIAPREVGYVEAHGTGTSLGDPIEVEALVNVLGEGRDQPLMIGSVKTNIGHLEAAAGIAGLIKAVCCVEGGVIPAHRNLTQRNPDIDSGPVDLVIPDQATAWDGIDGKRVAGVSAFGFGGTNAHVVLEGAPADAAPAGVGDGRVHVLPLSARSETALAGLADAWATALETGRISVADAVVTATTGRAQLSPWRLAASGADAAALAASLRAAQPVKARQASRVAFLFTGQGAQYPGMARQAYQIYPVFRAALDRAAAILAPLLPPPPLELLFGTAPLDDTALAQPLTVAVELALAALWQSWGIRPAAVLGHSVGEYAAAVVAGAATEAEVLALVAARGRMMSALPPGGGMLAVFTDSATLDDLVQQVNREHGADPLSLAAINGPLNSVAAGGNAALDALALLLDGQGIEHRRLAVSHAFHSARLDPVLRDLERLASAVDWQVPQVPLLSNLTGAELARLDGAYWRDHARQPVRFADGLAAAVAMGCDLFVELGAQPVLSGLVAASDTGTAVPSLRRGRADDEVLMAGVARLYGAGVTIDWAGVDGATGQKSGGRRVAAPQYPFRHQRYWLDLPQSGVSARSGNPALTAAPTRAEGSQTVYGFYDELTVVARTYETTSGDAGDDTSAPDGVEAEAHLTFGFFPEPVPGFSWVRALFEKDADPAAHALFRSSQRALKDSLFDGVDFSQIRRVFDYGCGHAADLCALALANPHLSAQGFTISARQVEVGTRRIRRLGLADRVRVDRNDSSMVPFPGQFDLIFGFEVTGLIADKNGLFDNVVGHLAPGGLLVIADFVSTGDPIANEATNSFTPDYDQWIDLLSERRLRLVRVVDASPEVANWLDDPTFEATVDELTARFALGELTKRHLLSNENIGIALRHDVMRYLLLTAQLSAHETVDALRAANRAALFGATPYAETAPARKLPVWRRWLHHVNWMPTAAPQALPSGVVLADGVAELVARERAVLAGFAASGPVLDGLSRDFTIAAFRQLGASTVDEAASLSVVPTQARLRDWLVASLRRADITRLPALTPAEVAIRAEHALVRHADAAAELALLLRCGPELAGVLGGAVDPLDLLFPGGDVTLANRLYEGSPWSRAVQGIAAGVVGQLPRERGLRVIEIGGGTGATTAHLLGCLPAGSRYLFTDLGASLVARAEERFGPGGTAPAPDGVVMEFARLDIARNPAAQRIATAAFDLVVAANVLHATDDLARALDHARSLLAPGGLLLLVENTGTLAWGDLTFGLTEGMWAFTDTALRDYALLRQEQWQHLLPQLGFADTAILTPGEPDQGGVSQQCVILARRPDNRHWALVGGNPADRAMLADTLVAHGDRVTQVSRAADCPADTDSWVLLDDVQAGKAQARLEPALELVQHAQGRSVPPSVVLVTAGAEAGLAGAAAVAGTLPGFARTVVGEAPELGCRLIDLDPALGLADQAEWLVAELRHGLDSEAAWRKGIRQTPALARLPVSAEAGDTAAAIRFDGDAGYLITGGLGGIGLALAAWLVERGARHLILAGRNPPRPADEAILQSLRDQGASLTIRQADVGNRDQLADLLSAGPGRQRLKGVFHSAGQVEDAMLAGQSWPGMARVLNAKLDGSWHLHELARDLDLDHFVLFSSAAGLIGPAGQANHAAANSAVDAIAAIRRAEGLPALSIGWGAWARIGAAVVDGVRDHVGRTGLIHMDPDAALAAMEHALLHPPADGHIAILDADWPGYGERFVRGAVPVLLRGLVTAPRRTVPSAISGLAVSDKAAIPVAGARRTNGDASTGWRDGLAVLPGLLRLDGLRDRIRAEAARIMRLPDAGALDDDRALRDLGLDSLMSVELRNALMARVDSRLPATLLFDRPSVAALADYLAGDALASLFPVTVTEAGHKQDVAAAPPGDDLADLDADALSALLAAELGEEVG